MIKWNYDETTIEETSFEPIPVGEHKIRVTETEELTSKTGKEMIKFTFDVSNQTGKLFYYLVFLPENKGMTNKNIRSICGSFCLDPENFNPNDFINKVGACMVKHRTYNDRIVADVNYFIDKDLQVGLPNWVEKTNKVCF